MGNFLKGIDKAAGRLIGIDKDANGKAAKMQAQATRDAAAQVANDNAFAVQANQNQIEAQAAQAIARQKANDLLGRPMETATVDLSDASSDDGEDLLGRKRSTRSTYRSSGKPQSGLVV